MSAHCPDCGTSLERMPEQGYGFREGVFWYLCRFCQTEWEFDYGGVVPYHDGPKIKKAGGKERT